jgi:hypothetical protein
MGVRDLEAEDIPGRKSLSLSGESFLEKGRSYSRRESRDNPSVRTTRHTLHQPTIDVVLNNWERQIESKTVMASCI